MPRPFLTAHWESLLLLNYACPPALLEPLLPDGTVLDTWEGRAFVSLVGFLFRGLCVRGVPIPFHREFEEVNLRFYVRRVGDDARRAVVFVREFVPLRLIAAAARLTYNEPYSAASMSHRVALTATSGGSVEYAWRHAGVDFKISATVAGPARRPAPGSEAEFITEHYWGYTRQRDGSTLEYQVEHPSWQVWEAPTASFAGPAERLYGAAFGGILAGAPVSAHVAVGSEVAVHAGRRLTREAGSGAPTTRAAAPRDDRSDGAPEDA